MIIESKFRKLFWIRIVAGLFLFLLDLYFCLNAIFTDINNPPLMAGIVLLLFLMYLSIDLFKLFTLKITENGIENTILITRKKQFIQFENILNIKQEKVRLRNTRGYINDGYHRSLVEIENSNSLIISPDYFENYAEIILVIKKKIENA